jgi:HD-like signal output (HDOD) protein/ActR/RegA family two-component response regulator
MSEMPFLSSEHCCDERPKSATTFIAKAAAPADAKPAARTRILFVDDEPAMIRVLKMGMRPMAAEWDVQFAEGGEAGLALVQKENFDVVVTDMRMAGINGAQLLNHVLRHNPETIRIVLSGYADLSEVVNCVGLTHQFLTKPCSLDDLKGCLKKVSGIKEKLEHAKLRELTGGLACLPGIPELYLEITEALQSPLTSSDRIAEIASKDPALSAKILQIANSAFFGFSRKVFSVEEAVQLLGIGVIQSLSLAVPLFTAYDRTKCPNFHIDQMWEHSAEVAAIARRIYNEHLDDTHRAEQAFAAGIMHDVGKLILADKLPEQYNAILAEAKATNTELFKIERQHFNATHAEVGAYLLALWGLPVPLIEAIAAHHAPRRCGVGTLCLAGVVHIADALQHTQGLHPELIPNPVDAEYLKLTGLDAHYETWRHNLNTGS